MLLRKMLKKTIGAVLGMTILFGTQTVRIQAAVVNNDNICTVESNTWENWPQSEDIQCSTGVVMEANTGEILFSKGMDDPRYPASITKIMTVLVALENSTLDTTVTFTETGMADAYSGSSNIIPHIGETFTMEQCLYMMMLKSANDVCTQVAEVVGGTVENFVGMMNQKAAELGCTNTHFNNASGLPDENHYTSAHDMALISQAALKNEMFRTVTSTEFYNVPATEFSGVRSYSNHHSMLMKTPDWYYEGCIGGKTGYTDASQNTLVTYVDCDGMELIVVVMRGNDGAVVCADTKQLLEYSRANFRRSEDNVMQTADGKYVLDNRVISKEEYQKLTATPTPEPTEEAKTTDMPEEDGQSPKQPARTPGLGVYIAIGVLSALILIGIILIIVGLVHKKK